ncbi:MAG TPA: SPFH domain-containing protein [Alphaproteobacteria bacterium]|nr:SPFH domain-containing protein [Alphaproteobacteria bacterium]
MTNNHLDKKIGFSILVVFALFFGLIWVFWAFSVVQYNEYAYEREFGKLSSTIKEPGIRYVGFGSLVRVNNQVRSYNIQVDAATSDMQEVKFDVNINARLKKDESYNYIRDYEYEETFIAYVNSKIQEKSKTIIFQYSASEMLEKRLEISEAVYEAVKDIPELQYFEVEDISLSNIDFSEEYDQILERKARLTIEKDIILQQKENLELQKKNIDSIDVDKYFKYQLIEKWDGSAPLFVGSTILG